MNSQKENSITPLTPHPISSAVLRTPPLIGMYWPSFSIYCSAPSGNIVPPPGNIKCWPSSFIHPWWPFLSAILLYGMLLCHICTEYIINVLDRQIMSDKFHHHSKLQYRTSWRCPSLNVKEQKVENIERKLLWALPSLFHPLKNIFKNRVIKMRTFYTESNQGNINWSGGHIHNTTTIRGTYFVHSSIRNYKFTQEQLALDRPFTEVLDRNKLITQKNLI